MTATALSPMTIRSAWRLGLWGLATWSVLRLHDAPIAREHTICGPWGCGPTIASLLAAHGFWLLVMIPGALALGRWLGHGRARAFGWICLGVGLGGIAAVSLGELAARPRARPPGVRAYTPERILFALATTVDAPILPIAMAGLILLDRGRRSFRSLISPGPGTIGPGASSCPDGLCNLPPSGNADRVSTRIEVGKPLPTLTLIAGDGGILSAPSPGPGCVSILYFMRAANCSICLGHVRELGRIGERLRPDDAEIIIVHPGRIGATRALAGSLPGRLTIASGRGSRAHDAIGLTSRPLGLLQASGTVLVDPTGVVRYARLARFPFNAFSGSELIEACRAISGPGEETP